MITSYGLALLLLAAGDNGQRTLPVDRAQIEREIDRLVDETPPCEPATRERYVDEIRAGVELHDGHDYAAALVAYRRAIALCPLDPMAHYELAYSFSATGDRVKALEEAMRARLLDPKHEQFYVLEGNALDDLGFADEAEAVYRQLVTVLPTSYMGHLNLGISLVRRGRFEEAETTFLTAREALPNHPSSYFQMALLARSQSLNYWERDELEKFVERGDGDSRLPSVEARLKELTTIEMQVDPATPHFSVAIAGALGHAAWRTSTHRETFPEARGYQLTFAEEKDVLERLVLPSWRQEKETHPEAEDATYDLLLKVADAGHLDTFIYYQKQAQLGEPATAWLSAHPDEVRKFLDWAEAEGVMESPAEATRRGDKPVGDLLPTSAVATVMTAIEGSPLTYKIVELSPEDRSRFRTLETARFRAIELTGDSELACELQEKRMFERLKTLESTAGMVEALRCSQPGEELWQRVEKLVPTAGLTMHELAPNPDGAVLPEPPGFRIAFGSSGWMGYALGKAAWHEESIRQAYADTDRDPLVAEEIFAYQVMLAGYMNSSEASAEFIPEPAIDAILDLARRGLLRGFILFEVVHKLHGVSLRSLSTDHAEAVDLYLRNAVLRPAGTASP